MIKLRWITISQFGCIIEPIGYNFESPGINLILGNNGRGKTTIFSALTWCIWGRVVKPDSNIEPWEHLRDDNYHGPDVVLNMLVDEKQIVIQRTLKKILLTVEGVQQDQLRNKGDVQDEINKLLGISFNLAKNSLIFGQGLTRLLSEKGDAQKRLFDEAFEAEFVNQAREKAHADWLDADKEYNRLKARYDELWNLFKSAREGMKHTKEMFDRYQSDIIKAHEDAIQEIKKKAKAILMDKDEYIRIQAEEKALALKIEKNDKKLEDLYKLEKKHFRIDLTMGQNQAQVKGNIKEILDLKMTLSKKTKDHCPLCEQEIHADKYKAIVKKINDKWNALLKDNESLNEKIKQDTHELAQLTSSIKRYKELKDTNNKLKNSLEQLIEVGYDQCEYRPGLIKKLQAEREELTKKLEAEKVKKPDLDWYRANLKKYKDEALSIKPQYQEKRLELKILNWLISDPLSNKGLKAYIFNSMLSTVNERLRKYARFTGFTITLKIDLDSGRKNFEATIHRGTQKIEYSDLSGGEKQLADVTLAFSIHDVISMDNRFNILIMDEVFESLDEENIDTVLEMLKEKSNGISIHLITHQKKLSVLKVTKVTRLRKIGGKTVLA